MRFYAIIRNNVKIILVIGLFAFVALLLALVIYLSNSAPKNQAVNLGFKGYAQLKSEVNSLFSNPAVAQNPSFNQFAVQLAAVENTKLSAKDRYKALILANNYLGTAYFQTNEHALYSLPDQVKNFAKTNFPALYKADDFPGTLCQDTACPEKP